MQSKSTRNKFYCPPGLLNWIELTNHCPNDTILRTLKEALDRASSTFGDDAIFLEQWNEKGYDKYLDNKYLKNDFGVSGDNETFFGYLKELFGIAKLLRQCANYSAESKFGKIPVKFEFEIEIEPNSFLLKPSNLRFIDFLKKEKIDIRNIRLCSNCKQNIFWLKRENQETCSLKCRNARNVKNWRKDRNQELNQKRRDDYKKNKSSKQKIEK